MHKDFLAKAAALVSRTAAKIHSSLHPRDNPVVWFYNPMYDPPPEVDIEREQRAIDDIMGTTRDGASVFKLVWCGDRRFWDTWYDQWDSFGVPTSEGHQRPEIRYKVIRNDKTGKWERDVFPPRWIIFTRLEPEQYEDGWYRESFVDDPELGVKKQIRPYTPPPVFYMWYTTCMSHRNGCCIRARDKHEKCFGHYEPPAWAHSMLRAEHNSMDENRQWLNPFGKVDGSTMTAIQEENAGYRAELQDLKIESEIFIKNPSALIGLIPTMAGMGRKEQQERVKRYFGERMEEVDAKIRN